MVRPSSGTLADFPDTVANRGSGYCRTCRPRESRAKDHKRPEHCVRCGHKTRPWMAPEHAHPGTRRASVSGICDQCVKAEVVELKRVETPEPDRHETPDTGYHEEFDVNNARRALAAWEAERATRKAALRRYEENGYVVQHNTLNDVAVILSAGLPVTATHGLSQGLALARTMPRPQGPSKAATMADLIPGLAVV